jgi:hypothetical protein
MTIHFSKAVVREASVVRYIAMLRKGYASPSLDADSATSSWRMESGTFVTANFPPRGPKRRVSDQDDALTLIAN